ncbi:B-cell linker protein isoform X4 [Oryzias melastigma]|uniref:B-cell linker protein isoform X4 n=1 Tax=Oryzias melastigma TaxID=30732 RepID=UPI000CF83D4D|nr:B-cell linker protein isoform X4 [Oryzias melastigma]
MKMTFFGKLKNLNAGPPAPPRRPGNSGFDWPQDEFTDDEEGDMYEAPPCERPAVKVPQTQVQDNIYLERTTNPGIPKREAAPLPPQAPKNMKRQQRQDLINDMKKPPEVDRNDKPGRKKMMPPPPPPVSESNEEDVYLDPNQEPEENDDLYLEPEAACSPGPRAPMRKPPSPSTAAVPMPMAKPPIPGGKSSSMFPPVIDRKTGGMRVNKPLRDEDKEWFAGDCTRKTAEDFLERVNKDGAFLIRHSSDQRTSQPFTLAVLYQQKVYNIPIRFLEDVQGYALGKEGKTNEETFSSLDEMISHHKKNKLLLIDSKSQAKHSVHLTYPGRP